ncbi:hypothetical protein U9M48_014713 [Paspalum notatum var. saurae]|uniref:Uncharacterized protein n=1 Tax=Paspalum notatum var. saurae TaxID=547442 RepID=A0AAQ3T3C2_PASNO
MPVTPPQRPKEGEKVHQQTNRAMHTGKQSPRQFWTASRAGGFAVAWRGVRAKRWIARPPPPSLLAARALRQPAARLLGWLLQSSSRPGRRDLIDHLSSPGTARAQTLSDRRRSSSPARMDRRPERDSNNKAAKRAREDDDNFPFEEAGAARDDAGEASRRPPGVFQFPWQKCRGGLGVAAPGWELRDVFFRSLVDGGAAAIGVPGDRLVSPPPSKRALLDGVDAWLAAAADGEVDPVWRSALMARAPASSASAA